MFLLMERERERERDIDGLPPTCIGGDVQPTEPHWLRLPALLQHSNQQ